ncbi:MAG: aminopeptidase [Ruminococcaceae bacterium]|nr:aminopeptidase [Oscillospiraceae bacterium]
MTDPRVKQLAHNLVNFSCDIKPGEKILIESIGGADDLARELIKEAYAAGATPYLWLKDNRMQRELLLNGTPEQFKLMAEVDAALMSQMDAYVGLRSGSNASEMKDVPAEKLEMQSKYYWQPVHGEIRVPHTKWVVLRYPHPSMAQQADMSTEAFEDYYFNVCNLDYSRMDTAMDPLCALMERTDKVRIVGNGTDLTFSIKGLPPVKCAGKCNIPDGEVYTAPVANSVNGVIRFNTPTVENGFTFTDVELTFRDGKIVKATSNDTERINKILDIDEGARYVGEFAFGVNPYINVPMKDTLFDEKIAGSFHFTPGSCYDECDNGNHSALHWDMVCIQTPEYGGGEIWFDDVLIRKDGRFVLPELAGLNPENLM